LSRPLTENRKPFCRKLCHAIQGLSLRPSTFRPSEAVGKRSLENRGVTGFLEPEETEERRWVLSKLVTAAGGSLASMEVAVPTVAKTVEANRKGHSNAVRALFMSNGNEIVAVKTANQTRPRFYQMPSDLSGI